MSFRVVRDAFAYVSVAVIAALSDWVVFSFISWGFPERDVVFAQIYARLTGGLVAFLMHRAWSFRDQQGLGLTTEAGRFIVLYVFSFCLSIGTVWLLVDVFNLNRFGSKAFADTLCFLVNFIVMKSYVFSDNQSSANAAKSLDVAK
jgi:putative flippase GtrA